MNGRIRNLVAGITLLALMATIATGSAQAQPTAGSDDYFNFHFGRDIAIGSTAIGAGVGLGLYFILHGHHLTGCVALDPSGLALTTSSDRESFALVGDLGAVKPGQLVRVSGKKEGRNASGNRTFLVKSVSKDFGACEAHPAQP